MLTALATSQGGCYVLTQAYHHNKLYSQKKPISEVISSSETPKGVQQRLLWAQDIIQYARQQGLEAEGVYDHYIETSNKPVSYIVYAAAPDKLESKHWWFPIVGSVPYLGFFEEKERDEEAAKLKDDGYDVAKGGAGAFSTLGWFSDPIFRSMLERSHAELAHLLFHELTHRTTWVSGNVDFNESMAEFVGYKLTLRYLQEKGLHKDVAEYLDKQEDQKTFHRWLLDLKAELEKVFAEKKGDKEEVLQQKQNVYQTFLTKKKPSFKTNEFDFYFKKDWNNAVLLGIALYDLDMSIFERAYDCLQPKNVGDFLEQVESVIEDDESPEKMLEEQCRKRAGNK